LTLPQNQRGIIRDLHESAPRTQQTKKTQIPVSIAHDMILLQEVQRELGL
jgi:hypothetical protein